MAVGDSLTNPLIDAHLPGLCNFIDLHQIPPGQKRQDAWALQGADARKKMVLRRITRLASSHGELEVHSLRKFQTCASFDRGCITADRGGASVVALAPRSSWRHENPITISVARGQDVNRTVRQ